MSVVLLRSELYVKGRMTSRLQSDFPTSRGTRPAETQGHLASNQDSRGFGGGGIHLVLPSNTVSRIRTLEFSRSKILHSPKNAIGISWPVETAQHRTKQSANTDKEWALLPRQKRGTVVVVVYHHHMIETCFYYE
eukprot:scaffold1807_cov140-Cylindrotheca_fusiformis.AAC.19